MHRMLILVVAFAAAACDGEKDTAITDVTTDIGNPDDADIDVDADSDADTDIDTDADVDTSDTAYVGAAASARPPDRGWRLIVPERDTDNAEDGAVPGEIVTPAARDLGDGDLHNRR